MFGSLGCAGCHVPTLAGAGGRPVAAFTDLLLHDMGRGLTGAFPEGNASAAEWRTAPLWGLGEATRRNERFLHDGRAASVDEAIRWHGGEAAAARDRYRVLTAADAARLLTYLEGL